jgi:hypothetical protein
MSALKTGRTQIQQTAAEAGLALNSANVELDPSGLAAPIVLPDGKIIYPTKVFGRPIHEVAVALIRAQTGRMSRGVRLIGPPGTGKSQSIRVIAHAIWTARGNEVEMRDGEPFYGLHEMSGGPSSDENSFKVEFVPDPSNPADVILIPSALIKAMEGDGETGEVCVIDEPNTIRDVALASLNGLFDGRGVLYDPTKGRNVVARPGFTCILSYNPGQVDATDLPDAWYSRFPAVIEVNSNWEALAKLGAPEKLVKAAKALDAKRFDADAGLVWTPQFRDIESLWRMMVDVEEERLGIALWISGVVEQVTTGKLTDAEASMATRMLDEAGYGELKVATGQPNLNGYPRAIAA